MRHPKFEIHPGARASLNEIALLVLKGASDFEPQPKNGQFQTQRHIGLSLTDADLVGDTQLWHCDIFGRSSAVSFSNGSLTHTIKDEDYQRLRQLVDRVFKLPWSNRFVGPAFVENCIIEWCRHRLKNPSAENEFCDALVFDCEKAVKQYVVWVPIAHLEVAKPFGFGPVKIEVISKPMIDTHTSIILARGSQEGVSVQQYIDRIRDDLQGLAAVVVRVEAEKDRAVARAIELSDVAVGLLRFFSLAALTPWHTCPCDILGSEYIPRSTALVMTENVSVFSIDKRIRKNFSPWQMTDEQLQDFQQRGFSEAASLLNDSLTQFQMTVRSSLLAYGKGTTLPDLNDRMVYTFSALENLLLKDTNEPIQQNLAERMAFMLFQDSGARRDIVRNIKEIYHLRSQYIHHRVAAAEEQLLESFIENARFTLERASNGSIRSTLSRSSWKQLIG